MMRAKRALGPFSGGSRSKVHGTHNPISKIDLHFSPLMSQVNDFF